MKKQILFLAIFMGCFSSHAKEGMWLPWMLSSMNIEDMQANGMQLSAEDIYDINNGSLKDAIVSFGGFCTAEVISEKGLILTNHHCGYGQIQSHSSVDNDLLKNGFWAMNASEELTNKGLTATFIKYVKDVTSDVLGEMDPTLTRDEQQKIIKERIEAVVAAEKEQTNFEVFVRPFYYGNQYFLFATEVFKDVRLVGAPPSSIGKFGSDTDNWVWPRHTGDFSMFRIYAGKDNQPAEIAAENRPYQPLKSLAINIGGTKPGDFTMVYGFPGRTEEYLPSMAISQILEVRNPAKIRIRETLLNQLDKRMRTSDEVRIQYAAKYARIANAWKKWIGMNDGLKATKAVAKKQEEEVQFSHALEMGEGTLEKYGHILGDFENLYRELEPHALAYDYFVEIAYFGLEILRHANSYKVLVEAAETDVDPLAAKLAGGRGAFYKNYSADVEQDAMAALLDLYYHSFDREKLPSSIVEAYDKYDGNFEKYTQKIYEKSLFTSEKGIEKLNEYLESNPAKAAKKIKKDPVYLLATNIFGYFYEITLPEYRNIQSQIDALQKEYMQAQMEVNTEFDFYPDANSTLRITYGNVNGFSPRDGVEYKTHTYLDGLMAKYVPGDYEFDVPEKLQDLYAAKDYGRYAEGGKLPVCFIASNHTSGGNSGSPALNANGELIGLNFDRVWEGTMSDVNYDVSLCRNIMVDIRYVLFIVDKYAGAGYLLDEMNIIE